MGEDQPNHGSPHDAEISQEASMSSQPRRKLVQRRTRRSKQVEGQEWAKGQ